MASEREPGWYWVKYCAIWMIAQWANGVWWQGRETFSDQQWDEIGERIPDHE